MTRQFNPLSSGASAEPPKQLKTHSGNVLSLAKLRCPRCDCLLADPRGMGLCPECGYCRSLADATAKQEAPATSRGRLGTLGRILGLLPPWVWLALVPAAAVLPVCLAADRGLPAGSPDRAIWGLVQLGLGLLALFAGQTWALLILRRQREAVQPLDVLFPFKLWSLALRWLPTTSGALALSSGGLTAVLAAVLWVSDVSSWLAHEPPPKTNQQAAQTTPELIVPEHAERKETRAKAAEALRLWELAAEQRKEQQRELSSLEFPGKSLIPAGLLKPATEDRPVAHCVVTGYILRGDGQIASLVLATRRDGKLSDAGVVAPALSAERQAKLLARLETLRRADPVVEGPTRLAVWVNPVVLCEVWHSGVDAKGLLIKPAVKQIVEE